MEHIQDDYGVHRAEFGIRDVAEFKLGLLTQRVACTLYIAPSHLDAANRLRTRRGGPVRRPVLRPLVTTRAGREQPGGQQPLSTAEIQNPLRFEQQSLPEYPGECRIRAQLPARPVVRKQIRRPVRRTRCIDESGSCCRRAHVRADRSVMGLSRAAETACSRRGSTSRMTGVPADVHAAWPS